MENDGQSVSEGFSISVSVTTNGVTTTHTRGWGRTEGWSNRSNTAKSIIDLKPEGDDNEKSKP